MNPDPENPLRRLFRERGISVIDGMNELQNIGGLISDLAVWPEDVAPSDIEAVLKNDFLTL